MTEKVELRIHGDASLPTLIYLPGLHGDWTLVGGFRRALGGRVRFVEITYPRTLEWSLDDYAAGIEAALRDRGIDSGWLLGESYGSQIVWPIVARKKFQIQGVILSGGFARHPMRWAVRLAEKICGEMSLTLMTRILFGYAKIARFRYRRSPETQANILEFIARRTELDIQAAKHRLHLVAGNNPRSIAARMDAPLYGMSGFLDPIVPWLFIRSWLRKNCPALRDYKIIWRADHNVLGTAPEDAAAQVMTWIGNQHG
jgi:pimeloyl-ACP methyl ester carboxylesterase